MLRIEYGYYRYGAFVRYVRRRLQPGGALGELDQAGLGLESAPRRRVLRLQAAQGGLLHSAGELSFWRGASQGQEVTPQGEKIRRTFFRISD